MASLYLLIPVALIFCIIAVRLLLWAINSGQYEDLDKEAWRVLMDEDAKPGKQDADSDQQDRHPNP
ncbi:cbb3-type cytochrome oxidase assembly protein CcoS [Parahaliea maris]|uniref:Cbb3-type cytochrome oxidase assembly protein CcoS n=1 Tax=Parahaliea maris TaxID=2716870 RepID=A0A5C9A441_9GAMM|nr:cbb3-type cytochrome oxidase assembly protein CcoS [Parahaliea maris]TXS95486.1 cbb3-type cytochrome oxidase assembly protein CcoS [Parahaliea maris]